MLVQCERCKKEQECQFYGKPSDVEEDKAQNGEWLCATCVQPRVAELDDAIARMQSFLKE